MGQGMKCKVLAILIPLTVLVSMMIWTESERLMVRDANTRFVLREITGQSLREYIIERQPQDMSLSRIGEIPPQLFENALVAGKVRPNKVKFTFAISCIERQQNTTYIFSTIDSLLDNANSTQKEQIVIIILLADFVQASRQKLSNALFRRYEEHFESGLIRTIQAPRDFYPDLEHLKITYHHPMLRVKWRSKQNYDFAYLMLYSRNVAQYYLQLEDDVTTVPNYIGLMEDFMTRYKIFTCLEFSELGFIAKLFHSEDLEKLAKMLMLFYNEQPNDVTYLHFNELMLQFRRIVRRPTLFQHHGYYSSLSIKRRNATDMFFMGNDPNFTLPVMRRASKGIRGPEAEIYIEREKLIRQMKEKNKKLKNRQLSESNKKQSQKLSNSRTKK